MEVKLTEPVEVRGEIRPKDAVVEVREPSGRYLIARKKAVATSGDSSKSAAKPTSGKKE